MLFYIPDCEEKEILSSIIQKHGGRVTEIHECYTYQICPVYSEQPAASSYFLGDVFRATWLTDSIKQGQLLQDEMEDYLVANFTASDKSLKRISLMKTLPYTLSEALMVREISLNSKKNSISFTSANFWKEQQEKHHSVPGRTSDSLRNLLKVHFKNGHDYDSYFQQNIKSMRFSHFFQEIPKPNANFMRELTNQEALYIKTAPPKLINSAPS